MREAAEAGRRQKEEHRRREHDEMFKQVTKHIIEIIASKTNQLFKLTKVFL